MSVRFARLAQNLNQLQRHNVARCDNLRRARWNTCTRRRRFLNTGVKKPEATQQRIEEPTYDQLRLVVLQATIPFIGFGFMDNALLIIAGDAIDSSIGVMFGLSTMCAAAIGNLISDLAGVALGTVIEDFAAKLNLPVAVLTHSQRQLRSVRLATQYGTALGLTIGCTIGMFPLLLIDSKAVEKKKRTEALEALCRDVVVHAKDLISAESTCLFLVVKEEIELPWHMDKDSRPSYISKSKQDFLIDWEVGSGKQGYVQKRVRKDLVAKSTDSAFYDSSKPTVIPFGLGLGSLAAALKKPVLSKR